MSRKVRDQFIQNQYTPLTMAAWRILTYNSVSNSEHQWEKEKQPDQELRVSSALTKNADWTYISREFALKMLLLIIQQLQAATQISLRLFQSVLSVINLLLSQWSSISLTLVEQQLLLNLHLILVLSPISWTILARLLKAKSKLLLMLTLWTLFTILASTTN